MEAVKKLLREVKTVSIAAISATIAAKCSPKWHFQFENRKRSLIAARKCFLRLLAFAVDSFQPLCYKI
jgi:hypothetical protein